MRKIIFITLSLLSIFIFSAYATEQEYDKIIYDNEECLLKTHYIYPSPLEVYYEKHADIKYPFKMISTANYRGHTATWEITNDKFYLKKITINSYDHLNKKAENVIKLNNIFPAEKIEENGVFAEWFTGYIKILAFPYKEIYDSPSSKKTFYSSDYKKVIIVRIQEGKVMSETSYDREYYWNIASRYYSYKSVKPEDKIILEGYDNYISSFTKKHNEKDESKVIYTEEDFDLFLTRYHTKKILIPLTDYCLVRDATTDFNESGAFINSDLLSEPESCLLILQMGASNAPSGPWERYSGGLVQVILGVKKVEPTHISIEKQKNNVRFINNYGKYKSPKSISGEVDIVKIQGDKAVLNGNIYLKSEEPETFQEINLDDNIIPIYSIQEYIEKRK